MKRCGIFIFFNEQGVVERYITVLLKSLEEVIDKLIIIINGSILPLSRGKILALTEGRTKICLCIY